MGDDRGFVLGSISYESLLFISSRGQKIVGGGGGDSLESSVNDEVSGEQLESIFLDQGSPPKRSCQ